VRHIDLTEIAGADLKSIRRYSQRTWGPDRTAQYMAALRDNRDDLRPGLQMAISGRHCVFFEADQSRILVVRVLHDRMDYQRHIEADAGPDRDR